MRCQHFQRTSLKLLGQFHLNFICSLKAMGERVYIFSQGHMTKMAAMPIYGKNLKNLLQNYWADCFEARYVASGELVF